MKPLATYIAENDIEGFFSEMRKKIADPNGTPARDLDLLSSQWFDNERKQRLNLIDPARYQLVRNQTINGLLELANRTPGIPDDERPVNDNSTPSATARRTGWIVAAALCVLLLFGWMWRNGQSDTREEGNAEVPPSAVVEAEPRGVDPALTTPIPATETEDDNRTESTTEENTAATPTKPTSEPPAASGQAAAPTFEKLFSGGGADVNIAWFTEGRPDRVAARRLRTLVSERSGVSVATAEPAFYERDVKADLLAGDAESLKNSNAGKKLFLVQQGKLEIKTVEDAGNVFVREKAEKIRRLLVKIAVFEAGKIAGSITKTFTIDPEQYDNLDVTRVQLVQKLIAAELR